MIKMSMKTYFKINKIRSTRYLTAAYGLAKEIATQSYNGEIDVVRISEELKYEKRKRVAIISGQKIAIVRNNVEKKALEWSSGGLTYAYLRRESPYSRRNPKISPSYWHIINDHSRDITVPINYDGRRFKNSWNIMFNMFQSLTGRLQTGGGDPQPGREPPLFQSLTGRLQTARVSD